MYVNNQTIFTFPNTSVENVLLEYDNDSVCSANDTYALACCSPVFACLLA